MIACLGLGLSYSGLATYVGTCRSLWSEIQLLQLCLVSYPKSLHLSSSLLPAEKTASDGKAIGMAPDIPGLHLPGGGRLPAEHGKPGCSDLEETGDSVGAY